MDDAEEARESEIHRAARKGDHQTIRDLCAAGADLSEVCSVELPQFGRRPIGATALMVAAGSREGASAETVRLLLELDADPTQMVDGRSAAFFASTGYDRAEFPGGDLSGGDGG